MKKTLLLMFIIFLTFALIGVTSSKKIIIPNDAIRIRILSDSNVEYEQNIKNSVKDEMQTYLWNMLKGINNSVDASFTISSNLKSIDRKVGEVLDNLNYEKEYSVNFGLNYFPLKKYKGINYNQGYYKSLLITLGSGSGDNWWCVLFPPLCLIEGEEASNVEYASYVKELLEKYV